MRVAGISSLSVALLAATIVLGAGVDFSGSDWPVAASPRRIVFVDGDAVALGIPSNGTRQRPFKTIQEALELAETLSSITEIQVDRSAQAYVGPVIIERSDLALVGNNWFEGRGPLPVIARSLEPTGPTIDVAVKQSNVLVQGFEVEVGAMMGAVSRGAAIRVGSSSDITLRNLIVTGANPYARRVTRGILVNNSMRVIIEHCLFADIDHLEATDLKAIRAVSIENSDEVTVQNCEFTRIGEINDIFSEVHLFRGIDVIGGSWNTIRNNLFRGLTFVPVNPGGQGPDPGATQADIAIVGVRDSAFPTVVNNTIADVDALGVQTGAFVKNLHGILLTNVLEPDIRNNLLAYIDWVPGGFDSFLAHFHFCPVGGCDPPETPIVGYTAVTTEWEDDYVPDEMAGIGTFALNPNASVDPVFVDRANQDYRLDPDSRCVDAGDPTIGDPDGSVSDLGCYGGPRGNLPVGLLQPETLPSKPRWMGRH